MLKAIPCGPWVVPVARAISAATRRENRRPAIWLDRGPAPIYFLKRTLAAHSRGIQARTASLNPPGPTYGLADFLGCASQSPLPQITNWASTWQGLEDRSNPHVAAMICVALAYAMGAAGMPCNAAAFESVRCCPGFALFRPCYGAGRSPRFKTCRAEFLPPPNAGAVFQGGSKILINRL